jgi:hypothetical protein
MERHWLVPEICFGYQKVGLFGDGDQAVVADSVVSLRVLVGSVTAGGVVDERSQVLVALQEVAMHARSCDDDSGG